MRILIMKKLEVNDFPNWRDYYRAYQFQLAKRFYLPLLEDWGFSIANKRILDVGCGDGGFTAALAAGGARCVGVEIKAFDWEPFPGVEYKVQDITAKNNVAVLGNDYDLIVLRDVIEHIPQEDKLKFLSTTQKFACNRGKLIVTFPPYYSPYGLHQQALLSSMLKRVPYLSWLPNYLLIPLLKIFKESGQSIKNIMANKDCKMSLFRFEQLIRKLKLKTIQKRFYTIRPSHEIRYGWKTRLSPVGLVPGLNEIFVLGCAYLLEWPDKGKSKIE